MPKDTELTHVARNRVVLIIALNNLLEPFTLETAVNLFV
jgi:hypothetical protein